MSTDLESVNRASYMSKRILAPGATEGIAAYGTGVYVVSATRPVSIATDLTSAKTYPQGTGEQFPQGFRFRRLEIHNPHDIAIEVTIWAGFGALLDNRSEVIEAPTEAVGSPAVEVPAASALVFAGAPTGNRFQRRSIVVANLSPALDLFIRDSAGNGVCPVFPRTAITLPVSGWLDVHNPNGEAVPVRVSELYYFTP